MATTLSGSSGGTVITTTTLTALVPPEPPQGRLTLTSATPVLTATVSAATTIFYALHTGNQIPIYSGSAWEQTTFTELSNATAQSSSGNAGPAAVAANSNYDLFAWSNGGILTLSRGPPWSSDTVRGTGVGTTQISRVLGYWSNTVGITNGPSAGLGTYVGTVRSDGSSQINWIPYPAAAAGGAEAKLHVFNAYNRVPVFGVSMDSTTYTFTSATWRMLDASTSNRVSHIDGLGEVYAFVNAEIMYQTSTDIFYFLGVNRDSTTATPVTYQYGVTQTGSDYRTLADISFYLPSLGYHYFQAMERTLNNAMMAITNSGTSERLAVNLMM